MKKTFQTILSTSLLLVCTFYVQQLSAKEITVKKAHDNFTVATVKNNTRFPAHVTVTYVSIFCTDQRIDVPANGQTSTTKNGCLIKSVSATYTTGRFNVAAINFEATAGTAYGDFVIEEEAMQNINDYTVKIFRVGTNGLINTVKPGFTFNNLTLYPIVVKLNGGYGLSTELNVNTLEKKSIDYSSGVISFDIYVSDESGAKLLPLNSPFNTTYLSSQYTGKPTLLSTDKEKPTYQITGGKTEDLCIKKTNTVGDSGIPAGTATQRCGNK